MIGTDESNFLHNLLLTNRQFASLRKAFANNPPKYKIKDSTVKNNTVVCIPWQTPWAITESWFAIEEESWYTRWPEVCWYYQDQQQQQMQDFIKTYQGLGLLAKEQHS